MFTKVCVCEFRAFHSEGLCLDYGLSLDEEIKVGSLRGCDNGPQYPGLDRRTEQAPTRAYLSQKFID